MVVDAESLARWTANDAINVALSDAVTIKQMLRLQDRNRALDEARFREVFSEGIRGGRIGVARREDSKARLAEALSHPAGSGEQIDTTEIRIGRFWAGRFIENHLVFLLYHSPPLKDYTL